MKIRGRGLIYGLEIPKPGFAKAVSQQAFKQKLIIELAGADDQVLKFLPPLTIDDSVLKRGVEIVDDSIRAVIRPDGLDRSPARSRLTAKRAR
jgi:diaminobutyrate-2-oxoglutarate transaminase